MYLRSQELLLVSFEPPRAFHLLQENLAVFHVVIYPAAQTQHKLPQTWNCLTSNLHRENDRKGIS